MSVIENNKEIKRRLSKEFPGVRVKKGNGTACGWSKIYVDIKLPENCECTPESLLCPPCRDKWQKTWDRINELLRGIDFYRYYDDMGYENRQVNIHINVGGR